MVKIRPNSNPIPPWKPGDENTKSGNAKEKPTGAGQAADQAKTAADLTKSKTSRMGKLIGGAGSAAGTAAGAGVRRAGGRAMKAMSAIGARVSAGVRQGLGGVAARVERFQNIMQRHSELGYLVRLGGRNDDENDEEIKKAGLGLQQLNAGAPGGSPALTQLMDRVSGLNQDSAASEWAEQFKGANELIEQSGKELEELDTQLAFQLQTTAADMTQAETAQSEVMKKLSDTMDGVIGNL